MDIDFKGTLSFFVCAGTWLIRSAIATSYFGKNALKKDRFRGLFHGLLDFIVAPPLLHALPTARLDLPCFLSPSPPGGSAGNERGEGTLMVPRNLQRHLDKHYPPRYLKFCTLAHVLEYKINFIMRARQRDYRECRQQGR